MLLQKDVFLGTVYFSPERYEKRNNQDYLSQLEKEIRGFKLRGEVMIQGDFNARVGNMQDLVYYSKYFDKENNITCFDTNSSMKLHRNSEDNVNKKRGKDLIDLCITSDLYIVNGRKLGDVIGRYTCFQRNGNSVVDCLIASHTVFEKITVFQVCDLNPLLSDHCALTYSINLERGEPNDPESDELWNAPDKFIWDEQAKTSFLASLNNHEIEGKFRTIDSHLLQSNSKESGMNSVNQLTNLLKFIAMSAGIRTKRRILTSKAKNKVWFDKECDKKRKGIRILGRSVSREPKNSALRDELSIKKEGFKKTIKEKKAKPKSTAFTTNAKLSE